MKTIYKEFCDSLKNILTGLFNEENLSVEGLSRVESIGM